LRPVFWRDFLYMTDPQTYLKSKCLPEVADKNLNVVFCGMAAGKQAAQMEHHYGNPRNLFWSTLLKEKFIGKPIVPTSDHKQRNSSYEQLIKHKIGLTDFIVDQCGNDDELKLDRAAVKQARYRLMLFIIRWQPKYLAFNGKQAAKLYLGVDKIDYGLQPGNHDIGETKLFVLPSTSPAASRWWGKYEYHWCDLAKMIK